MGAFFVMIIFLGCSEEKEFLEKKEDFKLRQISFNEFCKNQSAFRKFNSIDAKNKQMTEGRKIYDSINHFSIDTDKIVVAESAGQFYYTFLIKRDYETNKIENLVLKQDSFGTYIPFILEYDLNEVDKLKVINGEPIVALDAKTTIKLPNELHLESVGINYERTTLCIKVTVASCSYNAHDEVSGYVGCQGYSAQTMTFCWESEDMGGSSGGDDGWIGSTGSTEGGGGGGGSQNTTIINPENQNGAIHPIPIIPGNTNTSGGVYGNGDIYTTPIIPEKTEKDIKLAFEAFLSNHASELAWWNNSANATIVSEMVNYLINNQSLSVEEQNSNEFALEMITHINNNPTIFSSIKPFLIEKNIDVSQLDPCGNSVVNRIKALSQSNLATIISRFGNTNSIYTLNINSATPINPLALAATTWTVDAQGNDIPYNYNIDIHPNETAASSDLAIAGTLMHEILHAYFLSLIDDCQETGNCSTLGTFPDLWDYYFSTQNNGVFVNNASQHQTLALNFVNIMAAALQEFDTSVASPSGIPYTNINQVYIDVAWYGLKGTIPYNNLPQADRNRLEYRFETVELLNQSGVDPNGTAMTPEGTRTYPCQ